MTHKFVESRWRPIPSCPGYGASDYGRIRNDSRGTLLGGTVDRYGYRYVNIMVAGERVRRKVHRLVCEAWHGACPDGRECGHLDGDKANNRPSNLAWITRSENARHQYQHGRPVSANLIAGHAQIEPDKRAAIIADAHKGLGGRRLANKHGVSRSTAYALQREAETPKPSQGAEQQQCRSGR